MRHIDEIRGNQNSENWEQELPDVPEYVHAVILGTLDQLEEKPSAGRQNSKVCAFPADQGQSVASSQTGSDEKMERYQDMAEKKRYTRKSRFTGKKVAVLAAAMTAVLGMSVLVAAAEGWWNPKAVEEFGNPTPELQEQMAETKVAEIQTVSATDAGITVTAVQTLRDANRIYMLFDITSEEAVVDANSGFSDWKWITEDGNDLIDGDRSAVASGGMTTNEMGTLTTQGYYFWDILMNGDSSSVWNGESLTVQFTDFDYYTYENGPEGTAHKITGNWELNLQLTDTTELARTFTPETTVTAKGVPVKLNSVTVTPLTVTLHYDLADVKKAGEAALAATGGEDYELFDLYVTGFVNGDGSRIEGMIGGTTGEYTENEDIVTIGLTTPVDVDTVQALILGGGDEIVLR